MLAMGISTPMLGVRAASYSRLVFSRIVKSGLLLAEGVISVAYVVPEAWDSGESTVSVNDCVAIDSESAFASGIFSQGMGSTVSHSYIMR